LKGAAFPCGRFRGQECSGYWPAGTAAFHISANVADAVVRLPECVDDEVFELEAGWKMLVETARLWHSLGHHDAVGRFRCASRLVKTLLSATRCTRVRPVTPSMRKLPTGVVVAERMPEPRRLDEHFQPGLSSNTSFVDGILVANDPHRRRSR